MRRRDRFFDWVLRKAKYEQGTILPRWAVALVLILHPTRIFWWGAAKWCYDIATDSVMIDGVHLPMRMLEGWVRGPYPTAWTRIIKRDGDMLTIEHNMDAP